LKSGILLALAILLFFIGRHVQAIRLEWDRLQAERSWVRQTAVIGYPNICPHYSFAQRPDNWIHDEGDFTYLWGGWDSGEGHHWFRIDRGDLEAGAISLPMGRDIFQAIDEPLIEAEGGEIWGRIPPEALVVGVDLAGIPSVYPLIVLDKVHVVNDLIDRRPILVTYNPLVPRDESVTVYEAVLDGRRVSMGTSGYFLGQRPLLYDRGSESLWIGAKDKLRAIAGPRKGQTLRRVAHPTPVAWGDWHWKYPKSRLLVGADRSRSRPGPVVSARVEGR